MSIWKKKNFSSVIEIRNFRYKIYSEKFLENFCHNKESNQTLAGNFLMMVDHISRTKFKAKLK